MERHDLHQPHREDGSFRHAGLILTAALVGVATLVAWTPLRAHASTAAVSAHPVAPEPPLPLVAPTGSFDPTTDISNVNGSIVVDTAHGSVRFTSAHQVQTVPIPAGSELRAVSASGTQAALLETIEDNGNTQTSIITVVTAMADIQTSTYELAGLVEPEAFSTDGDLLFVIDHQISQTNGAYRVRPLNLESGRLETIVGPTKQPLIEDMNGSGRRQVWSPNGARLNTLYIRQTHHHHDSADGEAAQTHHAHGEPGTDGFVHVLDLDEEWAHCLDLPEAFGGGDLSTTALAVSPDGLTLAVADASAGQIAFASSVELAVTRVVPMPDVSIEDELHLGLTRDAVVLASGDTAHWFRLETMEPIGAPIELVGPLSGFTPAPDAVLAWSASPGVSPSQLSVER